MQYRSFAGYWFNRPLTNDRPEIYDQIQGFGEVIIDAGSDGIIDGGGSPDYAITPDGKSQEITYAQIRQLEL